MKNCAGVFHMDAQQLDLPPGFRFHPTDQELILEYLSPKAHASSFSPAAIAEVDLNNCEPWDLPKMAKIGEKEWYFYSTRDKKYSTGQRTNRSTAEGYWKATGKDKEICSGEQPVGMKKTLVFYRGRAPKGEKSNWVMHEYRLNEKWCTDNLPLSKNEWVVCRVFHKGSPSTPKTPVMEDHQPAMMNPSEPLQTNFPPLMDNNNNTGIGFNQQDVFQGIEADNYMNDANSFYNSQMPSFSDFNSQFQTSMNPNYPQYSAFGSFNDLPSSSLIDFGGGEETPMNYLNFGNQEGPSSSSRPWGGGHRSIPPGNNAATDDEK